MTVKDLSLPTVFERLKGSRWCKQWDGVEICIWIS